MNRGLEDNPGPAVALRGVGVGVSQVHTCCLRTRVSKLLELCVLSLSFDIRISFSGFKLCYNRV